MIGIFLVNERIITKDDFFEISAARDVKTDPIGKIALRERILSTKQVMKILSEQASSGGRFGEVGIDLDFMTNQDLWRLLYLQAECRPGFLPMAVELGILDKEASAAALTKFRTSNAEMMIHSVEANKIAGVPSRPFSSANGT